MGGNDRISAVELSLDGYPVRPGQSNGGLYSRIRHLQGEADSGHLISFKVFSGKSGKYPLTVIGIPVRIVRNWIFSKWSVITSKSRSEFGGRVFSETSPAKDLLP